MKISPILGAGLGTAAAVALIDQAAKWWILEVVMQPPRIIEVTPFFNLMVGWNRGVSFGLFNWDSIYNAWVLSLTAAVIVAVLAVWLSRAERLWLGLAIGLVIGGAVGNVIDRVFREQRAVADFLDFHVAGYHWPAFNLADTGITLGAVMLVLDSLFAPPEKPKFEGGEETDEGQ